MNSSTTLLGKIIVTSAVEKREAVELSDMLFEDQYFNMLINMFVFVSFLLTMFILWRKCCSGQSTSTLPPTPPTPPPPSDDGFFKKRDYENFDKISIISQDLSINEIHDE